MHRHILHRTPAADDPSTPPIATARNVGQPPPLRGVPAPVPVFETPPGFQVPPDAIHPRRGVETLVGAVPTWQHSSRSGMEVPSPVGVVGRTDTSDTTEGEEEFEHEHEHEAIDPDVEIDGEEVEEGDGEEDEEGPDEEDEEMNDRNKSPSPLPPDLREISSLASWTVSTHKPGCGVTALRHPSPTQFWQSDGPQPHTLTLHFFKLVAIVKLRVYLDFELDESYTPTKMVFLAGMGGNDLVEFASWEGEGPCGWVDVPLEGVGGRSGGMGSGGAVASGRRRRRKTRRSRPHPSALKSNKNIKTAGITLSSTEGTMADTATLPESEIKGWNVYGQEAIMDDINIDYDDEDEFEDDEEEDPLAGNVLKAMVIQARICENHQNGKDTHVRGFQVFAHDDDRRRVAAAAAAAAASNARRQSVRKSLRGRGGKDSQDERMENRDGIGIRGKITRLEKPDWMGEPVIR